MSMSSGAALTKLGSETTPDGVLVLTINDPATRNALDNVLMAELIAEIKRFAADRELKVLLITGLVTGDGSAWLLPRLIGMANTLWMQYTGEPVPAQEAYRIGLVNEVTSDE